MQQRRSAWSSMLFLLIVGAIWCRVPASLAAVLRPYDPPNVVTATPSPQQQAPLSKTTPGAQGTFFAEFASKARLLSTAERDKLRESLQRERDRAKQKNDREHMDYYTNLLKLLDTP